MLILTNFMRFPAKWRSSQGLEGDSLMLYSLMDFVRHSRHADLVIINCDEGLAMKLSAVYTLLPFLRRPILGHDLVLRKPQTFSTRVTLPIKRFLLSRIDHYSLHFRETGGYTGIFGIRPEIISYLPSKPNIRNRQTFKVASDGEYVLCLGWSERDYDTFFDAMEMLPYPAAIPQPNFEKLSRNASRFTRPLGQLPANVAVLDDDLSTEAMLRIIERARLVVLPTVASRIGCSGIGTYLNAMLMGKCVITSNGPGSSDVLLHGEALLVPPEAPAALAAMIRTAWEDPDLRERTAQAGRQYSTDCGGEPELRQRVLDRAIEKLAPARQESALANASERH